MIRQRQDYSLTERWLHRLVLQSIDVRRLSFDLETLVLGRTVQSASERPVYLCGRDKKAGDVECDTYGEFNGARAEPLSLLVCASPCGQEALE